MRPLVASLLSCAALLTCAPLAACAPTNAPIGSTRLDAAGATSSPPTAAPTSEAPAGAPAPAKKAFPPAAPIEHQATRWAVVVALTRTRNDPKLAAAVRSLTDVGYQDVVPNPVNGCDEGMREGLKLTAGDYYHVSVYFADAPSSQRFVDAYQPGVVGTVKVVTGCAD